MSDSLQPHRVQPARLLCPWNSPGQNTGVGSRSLLQGIFPTQGSNPGLPHCRWILDDKRPKSEWCPNSRNPCPFSKIEHSSHSLAYEISKTIKTNRSHTSVAYICRQSHALSPMLSPSATAHTRYMECCPVTERHVRLLAIPWTAALQGPLSFTASHSLLKFMSTESVMLSNFSPASPFAFNLSQHQGLSNESTLCIGWPKIWSLASVRISQNKPAFTLLWLTLEFFPAQSQGSSHSSPSQGLTRDLGHDHPLVQKRSWWKLWM